MSIQERRATSLSGFPTGSILVIYDTGFYLITLNAAILRRVVGLWISADLAAYDIGFDLICNSKYLWCHNEIKKTRIEPVGEPYREVCQSP